MKRHTIEQETFVDDDPIDDYEIRRPNTEGQRKSPPVESVGPVMVAPTYPFLRPIEITVTKR